MSERAAIHELILPVVRQCTRSCACCEWWAPVLERRCSSVARIKDDLATLAAVADIESVFVCGGEPLAHPEIVPLLKAIKTCVPGAGVALQASAGVAAVNVQAWRPHVTGLIIMDDGTVPSEAADEIEAAAGTARVEYRPCSRRRLVTSVRRDPAETAAIWEKCPARSGDPTVHDGRLFKCRRHLYMFLTGVVHEVRAVELRSATVDVAREFLSPRRPDEACRRCAGPEAEEVPASEIDIGTGSGYFVWWRSATADNMPRRRS